MIKEAFIAWVLSAMTAMSPPHRQHWEPAAQESHAQADARYREIAETIVDGVFDESVMPVFKGERARQNTAMLVVVWWNGESGFRRDVDLGIGRRRLAKVGWNDYGRSWCMGQINLGRKAMPDPNKPGSWIEESAAITPEGWSGRDLIEDRRKCLLSTLRVMRQSVSTCRKLPSSERLTMYAAGHCESEKGRAISRARMRTFWRWLKRGRPKYLDSEVMSELKLKTEQEEKSAIALFPMP
jgi:hypothetical protein